jgi:hypothetical protein
MQNHTTPAPRLSWAQVCARRLERHALAVPAQDSRPADIASTICGAHAQVLSAAELSIGLRSASITRTEIQDALWIEHSLVKTFGPRGTVHLLSAHDLPMWIGALSALPPAPSPFPEGVRLTPAQTDAVVAAIASALKDAELTADELTAAIVDRTEAWAGDLVMPAFQGMWPRWRQAMATAANRGVLCFGPTRKRVVTYTSPRRWLPTLAPVEGQAALAELVRRYLHAYGPATQQQFAQWLGVARQWAAELFDSLSGELQQVEVEGTRAWVVAGDTAAPSTPAQGIRLLPYFDAYTVGCHPREKVFPGRASERALAGGQAGNFPVLLIDGMVAGVWHQRRSSRRIAITVEPLEELSAAQRAALDDQVARIGAFLESKPQLTIGTITVGAHA